MQTFKEGYNRLNPKQKEAVDTINGPVLVVAGPGTGKTQILTLRIANILKNTDANPENILALTFTENAARNMQKRLVQFIGTTAYKVRIGTFHNFANEVILNFPEKFAFNKELKSITDLEKFRIVQGLIDNFNPGDLYSTFEVPEIPKRFLLKPFNAQYLYQKEIISKIDILKKENITFDKYRENINYEIEQLSEINEINPRTKKQTTKWKNQIKLIQKNIELLDFFKNYDQKLKESALYDYSDMITYVINESETDDELLAYYQEKFLYILADEYQDTNGAQNKLLTQLASWDKQPNLFAVGDDDQSIYRFQGANIQNILEFTQRYPTSKVINISTNYRSSQRIIDSATELISTNTQRLTTSIPDLNKELKSNLEDIDTNITIAEFSRSDIEYFYVGKTISELIKNGTDPDEIAVIYTKHKDGESILDYILDENIPVNIIGNSNILNEIIIGQLINLFRTIENPENSALLSTVLLSEFLGLDRLDSYKIHRNYNKNRKSDQTLFDLISDTEYLEEISLENSDEFHKLSERIIEWRQDDQNLTFPQTFEKVILESNLLEFVQSGKRIDELNSLKTLFDFVKTRSYQKKNYKITDLLEDIKTLEEAEMPINKEPFKSKSKGVSLLTAHASKGLEFEHVFLPKVTNGTWGNKRNASKIKLVSNWAQVSKSDATEEERRLFFVALTRAKTHLHISHSNKYLEGEEFKNKIKSQFIEEINPEHFDTIDATPYENQAEKVLGIELKMFNYNTKEKEYLESLVEKLKLSVTALNTYLKDPQEFLYNNLLRIPRIKTKALCMGTAIHFALENFYLNIKNEKPTSFEALLRDYHTSLTQEFLNAEDLKDTLIEGEHILTEWYNFQNGNFVKPVELEYGFHGNASHLGDIPLTAKIDKIEWIDQKAKTVKVIDYKTGNAKSRGVLSKPVDGDEKSNYYRQLVFYKLIADITDTFPYRVVESEIEFIKSDKGKFRKESFEIPETDVMTLKGMIVEVMGKIRNLEF